MRAVVLSGGGAKGAYQCGALQHLLRERQRSYDIICGVSVGALNGAFIAQYQRGDEIDSGIDLLSLWRGITTKSIYKSWTMGKMAALWKPSVYDSSPLRKLVEDKLNMTLVRQSGRMLRIGAVRLETGSYILFKEDDKFLVEAVLASSSFPAMLLPVRRDGFLYTDGGLRDITPLGAAIQLGATQVDVIMCSPNHSSTWRKKDPNAIDIAIRCVDIMCDEVMDGDIREAIKINKMVDDGYTRNGSLRNVEINILRPEEPLSIDSLDFDPKKIDKLIQQGHDESAKRFSLSDKE